MLKDEATMICRNSYDYKELRCLRSCRFAVMLAVVLLLATGHAAPLFAEEGNPAQTQAQDINAQPDTSALTPERAAAEAGHGFDGTSPPVATPDDVQPKPNFSAEPNEH